MIDAKHLADLVTYLRGFLAFFLAWAGFALGKPGLSVAIFTMVACWIGDFVDGKIARLNHKKRRTWIGDHDVQVDMFVSLGLGVYMVGAGYISRWVAFLYLVIWAFTFWKFGPDKNLLMLFQAPIYGVFIWFSMVDAPEFGRWLIFCILTILILNWRRFYEEVVPGFIHGIIGLWRNRGTPRSL